MMTMPVASLKQFRRAQLTQLHDELQLWLREDRLVEGASWFLVAVDWWEATFAAPTNRRRVDADGDGDDTMNDDRSDREDDDNSSSSSMRDVSPVHNAPLVDESWSSQARRSVVLRPRLAEERDYRLVSERVWNRLSHEFGFDWEIARNVIARRPTSKLVVEVYPTAFQVMLAAAQCRRCVVLINGT
ncbi:hypothetical protein PINS_up010224 [Pythium insidiosum]|nr:hypothetical protein PINS_up010224 [Pythium insidiosum]